MTDPFVKAGWYGWAILVVMIICVVFACSVSRADNTQADGPAVVEDVHCAKGWCLVKQDTLITMLEGMQKLAKHVKDVRELCGWKEQ